MWTHRWQVGWLAGLALSLGLAACEDTDVGRCCEVVGADDSLIPTSTRTPSGDFINGIARDPAFDCESFTCVSYEGSQAYCTEACDDDDDCPDDFECLPVILSEPPPGSDGIGPDDRFCVQPGRLECS